MNLSDCLKTESSSRSEKKAIKATHIRGSEIDVLPQVSEAGRGLVSVYLGRHKDGGLVSSFAVEHPLVASLLCGAWLA